MINITEYKDGILLSGERIDPDIVFNCGQCFRFIPDGDGYIGIAHGRVLNVRNSNEGLYLYPVSQDEIALWADYFDAETDYTSLEEKFRKDKIMKRTLAAASGMRLLNQDPFETIITFIISANNNEKRIRKIVENICEKCGNKLKYNDRIFYAFPSAEQLSRLTEEELRGLGAGYRAGYIADTAKMVAEGYDLSLVFDKDYHSAKQELCRMKGVGPKVADCILLFAYKKKNAFPLDVWMKRVLEELYGVMPKSYADAERFAEDCQKGQVFYS